MSECRINSLADLLAPEFGKRTAVVIPDTGPVFTYRELAEQVELLERSLLDHGVQPGDVAVMALPASAEFLTTFLALTTLGAVALPVNPACTADELGFVIDDSSARLVIAQRDHEAARRSAQTSGTIFAEAFLEHDVNVRVELSSTASSMSPKLRPDDLADVAMILYTSGTTSRPKAVPLTHENIAASIHNFVQWFKLTEDDSTLVAMPPVHVHGLIGATLSTLYSGGTAVIPPRFSASSFWQDITDYGVTWYTASPTIHQILLKRADSDQAPQSGLRFIRSSSAKLPSAVRSQIEARFGTAMIEAYGMTEASNQIAANPLPPSERITGSVGLPAGTEILILDENNRRAPTGQVGEICIRGAAVLKAYRNNPEANSKSFVDGWFRTGDQGHLDDNDYLYVSGRLKDLINRGGEKISPIEVESVLLEHPAVAEAVCFAVPDEKYGEEVQAAVVRRDNVDVEQILEFCRNRLIEFKVPKKIHLVSELPRTVTNKIQRNVVAAMFIDES